MGQIEPDADASTARPIVLAVGEPLIELTDVGDHRLAWTFGGDTFNCLASLVVAAPLATGRYLTGLGDDPASTWFTEFATSLGIDVSDCPVIAGHNLGLSWISHHDGDRTFRYWRGESAARTLLRSSAVLDVADTDLLIVSSITLAVSGPRAQGLLDELAAARDSGTTIALDTNHRPSLWPDERTARVTVERAVGLADIVHASLDDVHALWDDDARGFCERAISGGTDQIVVTAGAGPITAFADGRFVNLAATPVDVIDTTGAGDAFFGSYLGLRLNGTATTDALHGAVDAATTVVQTRGALTHLGS